MDPYVGDIPDDIEAQTNKPIFRQDEENQFLSTTTTASPFRRAKQRKISGRIAKLLVITIIITIISTVLFTILFLWNRGLFQLMPYCVSAHQPGIESLEPVTEGLGPRVKA